MSLILPRIDCLRPARAVGAEDGLCNGIAPDRLPDVDGVVDAER
jgi:hypothetical protein